MRRSERRASTTGSSSGWGRRKSPPTPGASRAQDNQRRATARRIKGGRDRTGAPSRPPIHLHPRFPVPAPEQIPLPGNRFSRVEDPGGIAVEMPPLDLSRQPFRRLVVPLPRERKRALVDRQQMRGAEVDRRLHGVLG